MAASGVISETIDTWRTMLATCTAFRTWMGNDWSIDQAKEHVHKNIHPAPKHGASVYSADELVEAFPLAVVWMEQFQFENQSVGEGAEFYSSGRLAAMFLRLPDRDEADPDEMFQNWIYSLLRSGDANAPGLSELMSTGGGAGYLAISNIRVEKPGFTVREQYPELESMQAIQVFADW